MKEEANMENVSVYKMHIFIYMPWRHNPLVKSENVLQDQIIFA